MKIKRILLGLLLCTGLFTQPVYSAPEAHTSGNPAWIHSSTSGWYQARVKRPRESIWIANVPGNFPDTNAYGPWNTAAGWYMIRPTSTLSGWIAFLGDGAEFGCWACAQYFSVENGDWYYKCIIHYNPGLLNDSVVAATTFLHEIGHCLGFMDHVDLHPGYPCTNACSPPNPQCNRPDQPLYSPYKGIMAHRCGWGFTADDWATLDHYGYSDSY